MFELLLYATMTCSDADALMIRVKAQEHLEPKIQVEIVETIKDSVPECDCDWDAND